MKRLLTLTITIIAAALVPSSASALTVKHAKAVIKSREHHVTLNGCHKSAPRKVICNATELVTEGQWKGWTLEFYMVAEQRGDKIVLRNSVSDG